MFGLDDHIAELSDGTSLLLVSVVAVLLGLRHATDPDHVSAVATLLASGRDRTRAGAGRLGLAWGAGHTLTLFALGLPIILFEAYLPGRIQQTAEVVIGLVIVALAVWLLLRWRRGAFHVHEHEHDGVLHRHPHIHEPAAVREHTHPVRHRTPPHAFAIGMLHGVGGSAGVGILIVAAVESTALGIVALALLAAFTGVSMTVLTTGLGATLETAPVRRAWKSVAPALGLVSLAFGCWYALGALELAPYGF